MEPGAKLDRGAGPSVAGLPNSATLPIPPISSNVGMACTKLVDFGHSSCDIEAYLTKLSAMGRAERRGSMTSFFTTILIRIGESCAH
jgi:hypothetical protein